MEPELVCYVHVDFPKQELYQFHTFQNLVGNHNTWDKDRFPPVSQPNIYGE